MRYPDMYELSDEAYNYNFGLNGYKENKSKAISLYKQTFKAGDYMTYVLLGDLIDEFDFDKAIYYFREPLISRLLQNLFCEKPNY